MSTKKISKLKLKSVKHSKKPDNDINDDAKLVKDVEQVQDAFSEAEEKSLDIKEFSKKMIVSKKEPSKTISEKRQKMMYALNSKKKSGKRNMYHYYYQNPFSIAFRPFELRNIPKVFNEKLFSMLISLKMFQISDQSIHEGNMITLGLTVLGLPSVLIHSIFHKLSLFAKLPYSIYAKIRTRGLANKVEKLFKTIINDIYNDKKYLLLQQSADANFKTNREEPYYGEKNKKYSYEFVAKLSALFIYLSIRELEINNKTYGHHEILDRVSLSQPIRLIKDQILNIYNEESKDDILTWFQDNYTFIYPDVNLRLPILTPTQNLNYGMTVQNLMGQQKQFNQAYQKQVYQDPRIQRISLQQNMRQGQVGIVNPAFQMGQPLMLAQPSTGPISTPPQYI
jgi:hypothetical protein